MHQNQEESQSEIVESVRTDGDVVCLAVVDLESRDETTASKGSTAKVNGIKFVLVSCAELSLNVNDLDSNVSGGSNIWEPRWMSNLEM